MSFNVSSLKMPSEYKSMDCSEIEYDGGLSSV